jgi:hypothetical protein
MVPEPASDPGADVMRDWTSGKASVTLAKSSTLIVCEAALNMAPAPPSACGSVTPRPLVRSPTRFDPVAKTVDPNTRKVKNANTGQLITNKRFCIARPPFLMPLTRIVTTEIVNSKSMDRNFNCLRSNCITNRLILPHTATMHRFALQFRYFFKQP